MVIHSVSQNSRSLKLIAIFSLMVYLCNLTFSQLCPNHILTLYQFWYIYLNIYMNFIICTSTISYF